MGVDPPDAYTIHWVSHVQINAFTHLLLHERDEQKALQHMEHVLPYLDWRLVRNVPNQNKVNELCHA